MVALHVDFFVGEVIDDKIVGEVIDDPGHNGVLGHVVIGPASTDIQGHQVLQVAHLSLVHPLHYLKTLYTLLSSH